MSEVSGLSTSRIATKPAALVLNGPAVLALTKARALRAARPKSSPPSQGAQVKPNCGRKFSCASMVPDLFGPVIVVAEFSTFMPLKPATNFSVSPIENSSCRWIDG